MPVEEFRKTMAEVEYIPAGSALHQAFHAFSQEALKITAELNGAYHTPEEVRALMSQLTASEIDESFAMFPPFHSDCGKNTKIGKRVFINAGCQFQDQGGITTRAASQSATMFSSARRLSSRHLTTIPIPTSAAECSRSRLSSATRCGSAHG